MNRCLIPAAIAALMTIQAVHASTPSLKVGLNTTEAHGVSVTRGKAQELPVRTDIRRAPASRTVSLDRAYRGVVFGQHRIVRDGQLVLRGRLLPVRQRGDE